MILGAAYVLVLYRRVAFGKVTREDLRALLDLSPREYAVFVRLFVIATLWMGVYPQSFLDVFEASVAALVQRHEAALERLAGWPDCKPPCPGPSRSPRSCSPWRASSSSR